MVNSFFTLAFGLAMAAVVGVLAVGAVGVAGAVTATSMASALGLAATAFSIGGRRRQKIEMSGERGSSLGATGQALYGRTVRGCIALSTAT
jgi:hypothetical protein